MMGYRVKFSGPMVHVNYVSPDSIMPLDYKPLPLTSSEERALQQMRDHSGVNEMMRGTGGSSRCDFCARLHERGKATCAGCGAPK